MGALVAAAAATIFVDMAGAALVSVAATTGAAGAFVASAVMATGAFVAASAGWFVTVVSVWAFTANWPATPTSSMMWAMFFMA
jgi:hypothetical protein